MSPPTLSLSLSFSSYVGVQITFCDEIMLMGGWYMSQAAQDHAVINTPEVQTTVWKTEMRCLCGAHNGEAPQAFCCAFNPSLPLNPQPGAIAQSSMHGREMDILPSHAPSFLSHLISRTPSCPTPALSIFVLAQQCSPAPPLFAFQQQPTQILMNPM